MEIRVPTEYEAFLAEHGRFEGFLIGNDEFPGYVALWGLEELAEYNRDIAIAEHAPGYLAFAGDGGGEILAFDESGACIHASPNRHGAGHCDQSRWLLRRAGGKV